MRSKGWSVPAAPSLVASRRQILVTPVKPNASTLRRMAARAWALSSMKTQKRAPRDSASSPSAPEPAKRSSTRAPSNSTWGAPCSSTLNRAWRTRSEVGRVASPLGASIWVPLNLPATMRMSRLSSAAPPALFGGIEQAELLGKLRSELIGEHTPLRLIDRAFGKIAERERPERNADEPVHGQSEMLGELLHLAVLAFAQGDREPEIRPLLEVDARLDRPVMNAIDGDASAQAVERLLSDAAMRPHAVSPEPPGARKLEMSRQFPI